MARHDSILVSRSIYQIGVVTLIASLMWVAISVYNAVSNPPSVNVDKAILAPLNTTIEMSVVEELTKRLVVEESLPSVPLVEEITQAETASEEVIIEEDLQVDDTIELDEENELIN